MRKMFTKKFWISLISVSLGYCIVLACGYGPDSEFTGSNFTPEAVVGKKYSPFFYSNSYPYYGVEYDNAHGSRFNESNVADWNNYLNKKYPSTELAYLLNEASKTFTDSIASYLNGQKLLASKQKKTVKTIQPVKPKITGTDIYTVDSIKIILADTTLSDRVKITPTDTFKMTKDKGNSKVKNFFNYLSLAKEAERFANVAYSSWDYESKKPVQYEKAIELNNALLSGFANAPDKFLKQRYWFQLIRSYFFNADAKLAIDFFESSENKFDRNKMYYRALAYAAGAYYKLKNYSKANYYYSLVYDGCDELKIPAHYSFRPQEEDDWQATLLLCKSKQEKITLWQMLGVSYGDEKRSIKEIYQLDPSSDKLNLLLARAINKQEKEMSSDYGGIDAEKMMNIEIDKDLFTLVKDIAKNPKANDPFMWNAAAGYLQMLSHNYKQAELDFKTAEKNVTNDKLKQWQLRLLKALNKLASVKKADEKFEKEILADVEWLHSFTQDKAGAFRYTDAFVFIKKSLAKKYQEQAQWVKSECFVTGPDFYMKDKNVEAMKSFIQKKNKSPYEKLCFGLYPSKLEDLYEYQAIRLAYEDKIDAAIAMIEKAGEYGNGQLMGNPFNGHIGDCNDCDHYGYKGTQYTKLSLLKKMKEMEANVQAGKDLYNNTLLLGNVFYNLSHYGNARAFYESVFLGSYHYSPNVIDSVFRHFLTSNRMATAYYQKALSAAADNEQKAKCIYMLAKCERNEWYNKNVFNTNDYYYSRDMVDLKAVSNFKMLQQYADTKYYQEVIKECGYFRTFINKN